MGLLLLTPIFSNALRTFLVPKATIKIAVTIERFSSFSHNFCYIWWFFWVLHNIWYSLFWKIIKYCKNLGENEEKSFDYSITQMATFRTKNVHRLECEWHRYDVRLKIGVNKHLFFISLDNVCDTWVWSDTKVWYFIDFLNSCLLVIYTKFWNFIHQIQISEVKNKCICKM